MEEKTIRKYANLMKELELTGLEITESGHSIRLEMGRAEHTAIPSTVSVTNVARDALAPVQSAADSLTIISPMVGVFYAAAAENQPPLVAVGQAVKKGDVVCVIESMKLMNEIVSEYNGVIEEICVQNQQQVDYGHELFKMVSVK